MKTIKEYIRGIDNIKDNYLNGISSKDTCNGYKYVINGTQVEVTGCPTPNIGNSVVVRGKSKDIPCIIDSINDDTICLKPIGSALRWMTESYVYDTKYAAGSIAVHSTMKPEVFVVIKPGFINRASTIIDMFEDDGFKLQRTRAKLLTYDEAKKMYKMHKDEDFYKPLCKYMSSDVCYGMIFTYDKGTAEEAIKRCNKLKDKIRDMWSKSDMKNVIHSSDSVENMQNEMGLFF